MSADNYLFVTKKADNEYVVYMRSASEIYPMDDDQQGVLHSDGSPSKALAWAHRYVIENPPVEYGVNVSEEVLADLGA